jgi:ABC-type branched-subunit amino acid transport system substrate-binding protein
MELSQTFATSMTWPAQGKLMADFMVTKLKARKRKSAMVWYDSPNHRGAHSVFVRSMRRRKADVYSRSVPTQANTADATAVVQELDARDVRNVYVHVTPAFFIQLLRAAAQSNYRAHWTGIDYALQASEPVANEACGADAPGDGARFFSPYPALADRDRFDKSFDRALNRLYPDQDADETLWGNWAQQKVIARLLRLPGRNLTRARFVYFAERARVETGVGSKLHYRPKNHFGARQAHLNLLDCSGTPEWHTTKAFVSDF